MTQRLLFSCLALLLAGGCAIFKRKPKDTTPITAEVQETFRKRWVDKRTADLVALGTAADAARAQAEREFVTTYNFPPPPAKK